MSSMTKKFLKKFVIPWMIKVRNQRGVQFAREANLIEEKIREALIKVDADAALENLRARDVVLAKLHREARLVVELENLLKS